jgi:hypothetical protein
MEAFCFDVIFAWLLLIYSVTNISLTDDMYVHLLLLWILQKGV